MEDDSLPNYLKEFITNENQKYLNTRLIHSNSIDKHVTGQLDLFELQGYKNDMKMGESYFYCKIRPLAYNSNAYVYNKNYIHKDFFRA